MLPEFLSPYLSDCGLAVTDPATGESIATVEISSADMIDQYLADAEEAGAAWASLPAKARAAILILPDLISINRRCWLKFPRKWRSHSLKFSVRSPPQSVFTTRPQLSVLPMKHFRVRTY